MGTDVRLTRRQVLTYGTGVGVGLFFVSKAGVINVLASATPAAAQPVGGASSTRARCRNTSPRW
jgi:hypothetical protein